MQCHGLLSDNKVVMPTIAMQSAQSQPCTQGSGARLGGQSVFWYQGLARQLLITLKYNQGLWVVPILGDYLAEAVDAAGQANGVVVPMPMHWRRRFQQGFNPPGCLASWVACRQRLPYNDRLLQRTHHRPPQQTLPRAQRIKNVQGCIRVQGVVPARVILIDDVITTGATMQAAVDALYAAGAKEVQCWVVARAELTSKSAPAAIKRKAFAIHAHATAFGDGGQYDL